MSLTSSLADPHSPLSRFLSAYLPRPQEVVKDLRRRLAPFPAPVEPEHDGQRTDFALIGHTIDHRLRVGLGAPTGSPIAGGVDLARIDDAGWPSPEVILAVQDAGRDLLAELAGYERPDGVPLPLADAAAEDRLVRLCHTASGFETIYRCGGFVHGNSLGQCAPDACLEDLLAAVPRSVVEDIRRQTMLAAAPGPFLALRELPAHQRICGPVFEGSMHVGGADADFILGGCLIDCKATIRPQRLGRAALYQLAGYLLLDYHNTYTIDRVGLYLSRQGAFIDWDIKDFLGLLGARLPLPDLRAACHRALTATALAHTDPGPPQPPSVPFPRPRPSVRPVQDTLFD
ncbi:hypothetical protein OG496_55205 [Streptomyces sp. NBC_00988]|uniref:hypothetical protein n=1 Tax=Streptomyces sp. NBC_00988 TaxID=2903704 RepID=UPI00386B2550|nr:hypothetical protein OG496_00080 [Streptomyces sp. NBC_00988]WSX17742.1 hypothetical protein OG496_55205 [Streptomyces sp. NBC_00988]